MLRRFSIFLALFGSLLFVSNSYALLNLELTRGVSGAIPIAVVPFSVSGGLPPHDISQVVAHDLQMSGRFKVYDRKSLSDFPSTLAGVKFDYFSRFH